MSRIGEMPIPIPAGVTVEITGKHISVSGPKGKLNLTVEPGISVKTDSGKIIVERKNEQTKIKALHGLIRSLIANIVKGVTDGWSKDLELLGVGFRAQGGGDRLTLNIGYSHPVDIVAPEGITFEVVENTKIKVSGIDKQLVGQVAANIRKVRVPDVYKGKGIRLAGEYIRKKLGKTGKIGAAGAGAAAGGK